MSTLKVVHRIAVDVHFIVLRVVGTVFETGRTEPVAHLVGIHVPVGRDDSDVLRSTLIILQLRLSESERSLVLQFGGNRVNRLLSHRHGRTA